MENSLIFTKQRNVNINKLQLYDVESLLASNTKDIKNIYKKWVNKEIIIVDIKRSTIKTFHIINIMVLCYIMIVCGKARSHKNDKNTTKSVTE